MSTAEIKLARKRSREPDISLDTPTEGAPAKRVCRPPQDNISTTTSQAPNLASMAKTQPSHASSPSTALSRSTNLQPKNESIPLNFSIPLKASPANLNGRVLRIATWNVASLATRMKKGFKIYFPREDADIWILTETKTASPTMEPTITTRYPYRYFSINAKKSGYAGVAVFSRLKPVSKPSHVIPAPYHPDPESTRGRIVTLEFEDFWLVGTYVVNAGENLKFMDNKLVWMRSFEAYIRQLDKSKPVIWGGDVNIAPTALDIAEASKRWNKRPGYTEQELKAWNSLVGGAQDGSHKLIDVWRNLHPELQHYSFWDYRTRQRSTGLGWRLDMFLLSDRIAGQTRACEIRDEIYTSDHCPVVLDVELGVTTDAASSSASS